MEPLPLTHHEEHIGTAIVNAAYKVHTRLGPGLSERVYEVCPAHELTKYGLSVKRQVDIPITYDNIIFEEGLRLDLLVEERVKLSIR